MTSEAPRTLRILLLEDAATTGRVREYLCAVGLSAVIMPVDARPAFERALREFAPDVVVAGNTPPDLDARQVLALAQARAAHLPVIFIETEARRGTARDLFQAGAADFLAPDGLWRLGESIRRVLARARAARERQLAAAAAEHLRLVGLRLRSAAA